MSVESEKINYLNHLRSTLRKKFVVTQLKVGKQSQAYVMFNRMNDRGLPLANSDLAKDLILSKTFFGFFENIGDIRTTKNGP